MNSQILFLFLVIVHKCVYSGLYTYPVTKVVRVPFRDIAKCKISKSRFEKCEQMMTWNEFSNYLKIGMLLTNGYTKSMCGWEVRNNVAIWSLKDENNEIFVNPENNL